MILHSVVKELSVHSGKVVKTRPRVPINVEPLC